MYTHTTHTNNTHTQYRYMSINTHNTEMNQNLGYETFQKETLQHTATHCNTLQHTPTRESKPEVRMVSDSKRKKRTHTTRTNNMYTHIHTQHIHINQRRGSSKAEMRAYCQIRKVESLHTQHTRTIHSNTINRYRLHEYIYAYSPNTYIRIHTHIRITYKNRYDI